MLDLVEQRRLVPEGVVHRDRLQRHRVHLDPRPLRPVAEADRGRGLRGRGRRNQLQEVVGGRGHGLGGGHDLGDLQEEQRHPRRGQAGSIAADVLQLILRQIEHCDQI